MITSVVLRRLYLLLVAWALAACATIPPIQTGTTLTQPDKPELRLAIVGGIDFDSLHVLEAIDLLQEEGYSISIDVYDDPNLAIVALDAGDADFSAAGVRAIWAGISKGAKIRTLMNRISSGLYMLVTTTKISECPDLEGKRIGVSSAGGMNKALLDAYIQEVCPGVAGQELVIPGGNSRIAALLAGELDASVFEIADTLPLGLPDSDQFHTLDDFSPVVSGIMVNGIHANIDFAAQHPEAAEDLLRAILTVNRRFTDDPAQILVAAAKHLDREDDEIAELAEAYVAMDAWDLNGGLQPEIIEQSFAFYQRLEVMPEEADPSQYIDTSYLERVLDEIGRR